MAYYMRYTCGHTTFDSRPDYTFSNGQDIVAYSKDECPRCFEEGFKGKITEIKQLSPPKSESTSKTGYKVEEG